MIKVKKNCGGHMKTKFYLIFTLVVVFLVSGSAVFAGNWIINAKNGNLPANLEALVLQAGGTLVALYDDVGIAVAEFAVGTDPQSLETGNLEVMPDIEMNLLADTVETSIESEGGPERAQWYDYQWHLPVLQVFDAWAVGSRGAGVRVGVVDSGIDYNHVLLGANCDILSGATFVPGTTTPMDDNGHGTHVAGIIAAMDLSYGTKGIAPDATLIPIKVTNSSGTGNASWIVAGIRHAVNVGADIINVSIGNYKKKRQSPLLHCP
jgi:subtilisin family serine protease